MREVIPCGESTIGIRSDTPIVLPSALTIMAFVRSRRALPTSKLRDDGLDLGILLQSVFTKLAPDSRLLETAEGSAGVEHVVAVDPDGAGTHTVRDRQGFFHIARPYGGGQAIFRVVGAGDDFIKIVEGDDAHYRAKDFFSRDFHFVPHIGEDGGTYEVAAIANAISDALSALDIHVSILPMTPERLFRLLEKARMKMKGNQE